MLTPDVLISQIFSMDALSIAGADKTFSYYFHKDVGPIEVATDTIHQQSIFALAPHKVFWNTLSVS